MLNEVHLYTDGGSRGRIGPSAVGVVILDRGGKILKTHGEFIGHSTVNRAEYRALIKGLQLASAYTKDSVRCFSDSELVVNQMSGIWRVYHPRIRELVEQAEDAVNAFNHIVYKHVPRTHPFIVKADWLLNKAFQQHDQTQRRAQQQRINIARGLA